MTEQLANMATDLVGTVKVYISKRLEGIVARIDALEKRQPEKGERGDLGAAGAPGLNGKDGAAGAKGDRGDQGEKGERGEKGDPGQPGTAGKDGAAGLSGKDGAPGLPGENGKDGAPGASGLKGDTGAEGKEGAPGERGEKGDAGIQGKDGAPGLNGKDADPELILRMVKDAISLIQVKDGNDGRDGPALEDFRDMLKALVAEAAKDIPAGRDGRDALPGKAGADGLGFDDLRVEYDGERSFAVIFEREDRRKEFAFQIPANIDRGVYEPAKTYQRGDSFTYGGSIYITQRQNLQGEKPGDDSGAFRLAVKRGRDGKDMRGES